MKTNFLAALGLLVFTAACASSSKQLVPMPSQDVTVTRSDLTRIYFVREDLVGLQRSEIKVFDGETEIGALTNRTFLCWERAGGRSLGRAWYDALDGGRGRIEGIADLNCAAGTVCYFNVTIGRESGKPLVTALDPVEGRKLVAERTPATAP